MEFRAAGAGFSLARIVFVRGMAMLSNIGIVMPELVN